MASKDKNKLAVLNRYYKITKFYDFLKGTAIKGGITVGIVLVLFVILDYFFIDTQAILQSLVTNFSPTLILTIFFTSETVLGLLPPEIFIAWSSKMPEPILYLFFLALLSYIGGIVAYWMGKGVFLIPSVQKKLESKIAVHINNLRKWGGFFVVMGAMLPLPHAIVSFACGLINYNFKHYALWALFRFLRFGLYGWAIFSAL